MFELSHSLGRAGQQLEQTNGRTTGSCLTAVIHTLCTRRYLKQDSKDVRGRLGSLGGKRFLSQPVIGKTFVMESSWDHTYGTDKNNTDQRKTGWRKTVTTKSPVDPWGAVELGWPYRIVPS